MITVNICPDTLHEVENASKRLGCGKDQFEKNQYMCLPNVEKTSLVEFCYGGIMGIKEKGTCLEVNTKDGAISTIGCTDFKSGCPENHYWNHQFFNYPACQDINTHDHCYVQHPSCPANAAVSNDAVDTTIQTSNASGSQYYMIGIIAIIVFILLVLCIICIIWKKWNLKSDYMECPTRETPLSDVRSDPTKCPDTENDTFYSDGTSRCMEHHEENETSSSNDIAQKVPKSKRIRSQVSGESDDMVPKNKKIRWLVSGGKSKEPVPNIKKIWSLVSGDSEDKVSKSKRIRSLPSGESEETVPKNKRIRSIVSEESEDTGMRRRSNSGERSARKMNNAKMGKDRVVRRND